MAQSFSDFVQGRDPMLTEAFNTEPYELSMGKKNAGDVFFTFVDEDEKEFRIQFYTPQGLGKNVRQVFIGQKRGTTYPDAIAKFRNPLKVIASMIEATKQYLATPLGKSIDGYAINFSKKALERGVSLLPKIIRQSGLKQKLNVMDLTFTPIPDRAFVWVIRKGKNPSEVFDGPKMKGLTWDDPDVVGDTPTQPATSPQTKNVTGWAMNTETWDIEKTSDGPALHYQDPSREAWITPSRNVSGMLIGRNATAQINKKATDLAGLCKAIGIGTPPDTVRKEFNVECMVWWAGLQQGKGQGVDLSKLNRPSNAKISVSKPDELVLAWDVSFPKGSALENKYLFSTFRDNGDGKVSITNGLYGNRNGAGTPFNSPKSFLIDFKNVQGAIQDRSDKLEVAARQVSGLGSQYNPYGLYLDELSVDPYGMIKFKGKDLSQSANRGIVLDTVTRGSEEYESKKVPQKPEDFMEKAMASAPKGRDLDWNVTAYNNTLTLGYSITFRRNTRYGAFQQYGSQIRMANDHLQTVLDQAKASGFKILDIQRLTADSARREDERAADYGEDAYSEYEQAIGGMVTIASK